jgi:hypothetical protein
LTALVGAFVAFNLYLWALPISPERLAVLTIPLGIVFFAVFLWLVRRA